MLLAKSSSLPKMSFNFVRFQFKNPFSANIYIYGQRQFMQKVSTFLYTDRVSTFLSVRIYTECNVYIYGRLVFYLFLYYILTKLLHSGSVAEEDVILFDTLYVDKNQVSLCHHYQRVSCLVC